MKDISSGRILLKTLIAAGLMFLLTACHEKGRAEKAGESVDKAVEDAGEAIEDAGDKVKKETSR